MIITSSSLLPLLFLSSYKSIIPKRIAVISHSSVSVSREYKSILERINTIIKSSTRHFRTIVLMEYQAILLPPLSLNIIFTQRNLSTRRGRVNSAKSRAAKARPHQAGHQQTKPIFPRAKSSRQSTPKMIKKFQQEIKKNYRWT